MRKLWLALMLLPVMGALAGCRDSGGDEVTVTVIGERPPKIADPVTKPLSPGDLVLVSNAAQGLVRFDSAGNIAPGLAERWAVSDDGLSYVFRLQKTSWSDGRKVRARDIVRLLERQMARANRDPLRDSIGAVTQVVAMTDRVIAFELSAPRPHLLQLLAQPEFGFVVGSQGTGPFRTEQAGDSIRLTRTMPGFDGDEDRKENVVLNAASADRAVNAFVAGKTDMVLGGQVGDLAVALGARLQRGALHLDPVAGLFGLVPVRKDGIAADPAARALLDEAIDRAAMIAALGVPNLQPRASILQAGLDGVDSPYQPAWTGQAAAARQADLTARAKSLVARLAGGKQAKGAPPVKPEIKLLLPAGPGGAIILRRLQADWEPLGFSVSAVTGGPADFRWIDEVAPSTSPAWFLRRFRCQYVPICAPEADELLDGARLAGYLPQRNGFFVEAEKIMRDKVLFIPVAAPVRWSLVGRSIDNFAENRFAIHTLLDLRTRSPSQN